MKKFINDLIYKLRHLKLLDKYLLKQVIEMFIMGVLVFTSIIFASDTFITLIKQISMYGIPFKIAFLIIILHLPAVFVMTIPMGVLLATVLSLPDKNGALFIQMGMIKTKVKKEKLAVFDAQMTKKVTLPSGAIKKDGGFSLKRYDISNTLDLRGERVEEALDELEAYLDKASLANLSPVYIIHGHGTGALKSAVRDFVSTSPYVAKYRVGEDAEGGDGVCVIDIK